jgi:hypothetical protein
VAYREAGQESDIDPLAEREGTSSFEFVRLKQGQVAARADSRCCAAQLPPDRSRPETRLARSAIRTRSSSDRKTRRDSTYSERLQRWHDGHREVPRWVVGVEG